MIKLFDWRFLLPEAQYSGEYVRVRYSDLMALEAELQKYKDQFPDYVGYANCGSVTHAEGVEDTKGKSGCQIGEHDWVLDADEDYFVCRSCGETT